MTAAAWAVVAPSQLQARLRKLRRASAAHPARRSDKPSPAFRRRNGICNACRKYVGLSSGCQRRARVEPVRIDRQSEPAGPNGIPAHQRPATGHRVCRGAQRLPKRLCRTVCADYADRRAPAPERLEKDQPVSRLARGRRCRERQCRAHADSRRRGSGHRGCGQPRRSACRARAGASAACCRAKNCSCCRPPHAAPTSRTLRRRRPRRRPAHAVPGGAICLAFPGVPRRCPGSPRNEPRAGQVLYLTPFVLTRFLHANRYPPDPLIRAGFRSKAPARPIFRWRRNPRR